MKAALYQAQHSGKEAQKKYAELKKESEAERRELADLREIIFKEIEGNNQEEPSIADESIFPYDIKHNTLVFGGVEAWHKGMKQYLTGEIRYISNDLSCDSTIIRSAAVIWIQINAISHSGYYRIANEAKKYKKPIRYFKYRGAAKCAEQLAENDKKLYE